MNQFTLAGVSIATALVSLSSFAQVAVKDPWIRATVSQQKATGAFMQLSATGDSRLVEVRSAVAGVAEIHEMSMDKDVMRMRAVPGLDLPAGKTVELKPGGYHIMLMDLKHQMKDGDTVVLTLVIEDREKKRSSIEVKAPIKPLSMPAGPSAMPMKH